MLPRGLRIEEEEQCTLRKNKGTTFFDNYKQQQSLKHFMEPKVKFNQNLQSYMRKLKVKAVN